MTAKTVVVVMGVSGCGKSTLGKMLAKACGWPFIEADDLHSRQAKAAMGRGTALTDEQRTPWLRRVQGACAERLQHSAGVVVACSALKRAYRDVFREDPDWMVRFVYLVGDFDLLAERMATREGHFMPVSLLTSQLQTLEPPGGDEDALAIPIDESADAQVVAALRWLSADH